MALIKITESTLQAALVGTPNSGKTSLFNALTGSRQKVANYPGVTVERKSGKISTPAQHTVIILDLPGTYSLRGRSPDEEITRDAVLNRLKNEKPLDFIIVVADSTHLLGSVRLILELKRTGIPLILSLNMYDIALHKGISIDLDHLSKELELPVSTSVAVRKGGTDQLLRTIDAFSSTRPPSTPNSWEAPNPAELRTLYKEADRIVSLCVRIPEKPDTTTTRIDRVLLHPVAGLVILLMLLFFVFQAVFSWSAPFMDMISAAFDFLGALAQRHIEEGLLQNFIVKGAIAGVGGVVIFLPQILILFFFILLLEDSGYMPRAAFLMDRIMGGVGLHGRAFIPLLSSFACAIPGIMAARVIDGKRDRMTTILVAPLMTCSARIPVYTLIISAFIPNTPIGGIFNLQGLVMFGLYAAGIISALLVAYIIKRFSADNLRTPNFMMQLPEYKLPHLRSVVIGLMTRAMIFLKRAGTIIFSMSMLIWFLASFPRPPSGAINPDINYSFAAILGHWIEPILTPIGFNWQISVALIPGMVAREVMVSALSTVYAVAVQDESISNISHTLQTEWSMATALSVLAWFVFAPQCISTLAVIRRELNSWRLMFVTFCYMLALAYAASFITYRIALMFTSPL